VVPTLASLTPAVGLTAGRSLVTIAGTGFRVGALQPGAFEWAPTVLVLFGGVPATDVRVLTDTLLTCLPPPAIASFFPSPRTSDIVPAPVAVSIANLDDAGVPIPGELVTTAAAYVYVMPKHTGEFESDFTRTVRTLIRLMKLELLPVEVNYAVQTDYDPTTGDELHVTKFATLPGIALIGPDLDENRFYSLNEEPDLPDGSVSPEDGVSPGGFLQTRVPYTVDVKYQIICASNNKNELLNLMSNFIAFMHANKWLVVDRNAATPGLGQVRIEMDFAPGGLPRNTTTPNTSNVVSWSANIVLRGLDIESFAGLTDDGFADPAGLVPAHAVVEHGQTVDELLNTTNVAT
jgi:IPT/TIG domain-containing protein